MTWTLLLVLTLVTVASRTLPMALLPTPHGRVAEVLEAMPAPLFASLAALALVQDGLPTLPVAAAVVAALVGAVRRSLGLTLAFGVAGFLGAQVVLGVAALGR